LCASASDKAEHFRTDPRQSVHNHVMATTSATYMYGQPGEATHVAVFGGDSSKASQHAANCARALGKTIGGPTWETSPQLNGGRPYRLYKLLDPQRKTLDAPS
jgi:hypothetical protein